ncbi:CHAT domain-containing protein [Ideonella sp. A 288]|uniref:CHAT domain-containing protein n=1 Tax=Ideonella sp. A 288 TaxID=1962181 RepID=UPI001186DDEB|nr:CHAT domain-containing protein [Ideonella sp. A 288]
MSDSQGGRTARFDDWCREHLVELDQAPRAARGGSGAASFDATHFQQADLLTVQFADGSVLHVRPQEFLAQVPMAASRAGRPAAAGRVELPFDWSLGPTRGGSARVQVDRYALARLTQPTSLDQVWRFGALFADGLDLWFGSEATPGTTLLAAKLCRAFENGVLDDAVGDADSGGLMRWDGHEWRAVSRTATSQPSPPERALGDGKQGVLLLLHGTASSTHGSFSALWQRESPDRPGPGADFRALDQRYDLLAWEHRTLTHSPVHNARDLLAVLARVLPAGVPLSLLSHSRGGMVGDLVCLALGEPARPDAPAADRALARNQRLAHHRPVFASAYAGGHPDAEAVKALFDQLGRCPAWPAGVFVRVASPSRGTLLADRRTDFFLSLLLRSAGLAFGANGVPAYERLNGLVRALVAARAEARALPGLEAMIPGSALTLALNTATAQPATLPGRLRVVAGDTRDRGWGGILSFVGDVFYGLHDHDFVVHTHSMFGGLPRDDAKSHRAEDPSVSHLSYFLPGALTRQPLLAALAGRDDSFVPLHEDEQRTRGWLQLLDSEPLATRSRQSFVDELPALLDTRRRAVLVVLPGIMGSELADFAEQAEGDPVWLSMRALPSGALAKLALDDDDRLRATGLMVVAYEQLLCAAQDRYHLVPFAFDWRRSIADTGRQLRQLLAETIAPLAERHGVPVHLLAHSMGGLVAREALFGDVAGTELWQRLKALNSRLLMLGTPNAGSYAPVQLVAQQHATSLLLASLARSVGPAELARWGGGFEGLMQMLPAEPDPTYGSLFRPETWAAMQRDDGRVHPPPAAVLARAAEFRQRLDGHFEALTQDPHVCYVAGSGRTPAGLLTPRSGWPGVGEGLSVAADGLRFKPTDEGDGTVPWRGALLGPERTWYSEAGHGKLADDTDAFDAYFELLDTGRTKALPQWPTRAAAARGDAAGDAAGASVLRPPSLPSWPADVAAYVLGLDAGPTSGPAQARPIEVRVVFGSLDYARYPLLVGHYQGDGVLGAVQRVDEKLGGQLRRMVDLKLFVGAERTAIYLRPVTRDDQPPAYPGAVVVGLGTVGELTPGSLADTVTRGVLRHAFEHVHRDPWVPADGPVQIRLSSLLIGTHVQAVTARDSLSGVLQGVWRAGQILAQESVLGRRVQIAEVEIIEIEEHRALDAAYELRRLMRRAEWTERLAWPKPELETRDGGIRGYQPGANDSVWQRLCVRHDKLGGLKFELIGERARVESTQVYSDVASLGSYIARVSDEGAVGRSSNDEQRSLGRVLYQLLLPQNLKGRLINFEHTVLVLDDRTAAYPWELLTPPDDGLAGDGVLPLAAQAGMVRQRLTYEFRSLPHTDDGWNAMVVGAPSTEYWRDSQGAPLEFAALKGAEDEAAAVLRQLAGDGRPWSVTPLIGKTVSFERVRTALLDRPYRLLHLCGHGVVDHWVSDLGEAPHVQPLRKTGMLLSHQQVLSAGDVEQMDPVPEFVFINCCYSGRDGTEAKVLGQRNYPLLAASLAMQFIKMGSKAVVAAGWQVDDRDGLRFAEHLYRSLLEGESFGLAVRDARKAILPRAGQTGTNTWGAYQCYGDPLWRLPDARSHQAYAQRHGSSRLAAAAQCMSPAELAERILQVVAVAGDKPRDALLMQLEELLATLAEDGLRKDWLRRSAVRTALGEAYRELGDHDRAVQWFQLAARNAYSKLQLRHVELMVNSLSRRPDARSHQLAQRIVERLAAIDDEQLQAEQTLAYSDKGASAASERECLYGSSLMRQAVECSDPGQRKAQLLGAAERFVKGYRSKRQEPMDHVDRRAYALANALLCGALAVLQGADAAAVGTTLGGLGDPTDPAPAWNHQTDSLIAEVRSLGLVTMFWHYTNTFELHVARSLLRAALGEPVIDEELVEARRLLERAMVRWPSPCECESIELRFESIARLCDEASMAGLPQRAEVAKVHAAAVGLLDILADRQKRRR